MAAGAYLSARRYELAKDSIRCITCTLDMFAEHCGEIRTANLKQAHVLGYIQKRAGEISANSLRAELSRIQVFTKWLVLEGALKTDPCLGIPKVRVPRALPRELEPEAVTKTLLATPDKRAEAVWLVIVGCGLRIGEIARLQVGDIDWGRRTLFVTGKGGHQRVVPMSPEAFDAVGAYLRASPCSAGPLFRSERNQRAPLSSKYIGKMVAEWIKAAGIKRQAYDGVSAHAGRHTAAGELLDAGADLRDVQNFLGHTHLSTTSVYTKRRENAERIAGLERRTYRT